MVAATNPEIEDVLARIAKWPATDRLWLARQILDSAVDSSPRDRRGLTAEEVIAQLNMPQPAPDDADCRRIVEEELRRKYGS